MLQLLQIFCNDLKPISVVLVVSRSQIAFTPLHIRHYVRSIGENNH